VGVDAAVDAGVGLDAYSAPMTIPVILETADLLAVDKPAGLPVIPARDGPADESLHRRLEAEREERLWVVHRIDRETSGVVLLARNAEMHRTLSLAFERRGIAKTYLALVRGGPAGETGTIDVPLHAARRGKARPARPREPGALEARTGFTVRRRWKLPGLDAALVEARPLTGRHHQIRVHFRAAGFPLLIDSLYGGPERHDPLPAAPDGTPACTRLTLHASRLVVPEDIVPGGLDVEAPMPADLAALVAALDAAAAASLPLPPAVAPVPPAGADCPPAAGSPPHGDGASPTEEVS
jgi:RluA family pseudouridine synthase